MGEPSAASASELRHRMANILQMLGALARMRSQRAGDPEARRQLQWMGDAIGAVGQLEQKRVPGGVDFAAWLVDMGPVWRRRSGGDVTEVTVEADPMVVPDHAASTLALIAHELVGNSLAHGFPDGRAGTVRVRLATGEGHVLTVADDGCGFDPARSRERFGLWFVRSLAAQVRGDFVLTPSPGVTCALTFKL